MTVAPRHVGLIVAAAFLGWLAGSLLYFEAPQQIVVAIASALLASWALSVFADVTVPYVMNPATGVCVSAGLCLVATWTLFAYASPIRSVLMLLPAAPYAFSSVAGVVNYLKGWRREE